MPTIHRRTLPLALALALLSVMLCSAPAPAQAPFVPLPAGLVASDGPSDGGATDVRNVELLNHLPGGTAQAIQVHQGYAYVGLGDELAIFDVREPTQPTLVSFFRLDRTATIPREPFSIHNNRLFIAMDDGIWTVSVTDPAHPQQEQITLLNGLFPEGLYAQNGHLYLVFPTELWTMTIRPNGSLVKSGVWTAPPDTFITSMVFDETTAYLGMNVMDGEYYPFPRIDLAILNLADPAAPALVARLEHQGGQKLLTTAERLYVYTQIEISDSSFTGGWIVYDRSNPHALAELARVTEGVNTYTTGTIAWGTLLLIAQEHGLIMADLADPANPQVSLVDIQAEALALEGDRLYAAMNDFQIYNATALPDAEKLGAFNIFFRWTRDTVVRDNHVIVVDGYGLHFFDSSEPLDLIKVAFLPNSGFGLSPMLTVQGDYLYTSVGFTHNIIDVSDPARPAVIGFHQTSDATTIQAVADDIVYLYRYDPDQLLLMDTSAPALWQEVATLNLPGTTSPLVIHQGRAYGATVDGLAVIDVDDPAAPRLLQIFAQFVHYHPRLIVNGYLYATTWDSRGGLNLYLLDISNRNRPAEVKRYQFGSTGYANINHIAYEAPYLYLADTSQGFYVLDATEPHLLLEAGRYESTGGVYWLDVEDKMVSTVSFDAGISLYRFTPPDETLEVADTGSPIRMDGGRVTYTLPAGFASTPISLTHAPRSLGPSAAPAAWLPTDIVFRAQAVDAASGEPVEPGGPLAITLDYAALGLSVAPDKLMLMRWDGSAWQPLPTTTDASGALLTATSDQFGVFALMVDAHQLHLPHVPR